MISAPEPATRTYASRVWDPARWNAFVPRADDIVVATTPKSGTTWVQAILALLVSGDPDVDANTYSSKTWIDAVFSDPAELMASLEARTHRRQIKTHTPFDGIPVWSELRYITVYRHPIDVHFSFRKHSANMTNGVLAPLFPEDISEGFKLFLEGQHLEGGSLWSLVTHYRCTLAREPRDNLLRLHYADMMRDLGAEFARIADFVGISHPPDVMARLVQAASFDRMKANPSKFAPAMGPGFWRSEAGFFDSASSNKWIGQLTEADLAAYDARMSELLSPDERRYLEWGGAAG